jgi:SpoIID/LytB domain protein
VSKNRTQIGKSYVRVLKFARTKVSLVPNFMRFLGSRRPFLLSSPQKRSVCATAIFILAAFGAFHLKQNRTAVAQNAQRPSTVQSGATLGGPILGGPVAPVPQPSASKTPPSNNQQAIRNNAPVPSLSPSLQQSPVISEQPKASNTVRVGLTTEGGAIEIYAPTGLVLRDKKQSRALRVAAGEKIQLISGPNFEAKVGEQTFNGPIFIQNGAKISQGWQHIQINVERGVEGEFPRVTTNGKNARWGRPYRGNFEVFPNLDAEKFKRKGALAIVNVVPLEEYLKGVVPWEMSPSAPLEALKAQAICARTKALQLIAAKKFKGFDVCDYDACQGYPGTENEKPTTTQAVELTKGMALYFKNQIIDAVFSTNSGGITAAANDVWNSSSRIPYLVSTKAFDKKSELNSIVQNEMSEADWVTYFSQAWPSYSRPDEAARAALAERRRKFPRTAALYGPEDWPEFYRWKRVVSTLNADIAFAKQGIKSVAGFEVLERTPSGRIRKLKVSGFSTAAMLARQPLVGSETEPSALTPDKTIIFEGDGKIRAMFSGQLGSTTALPSSSFSIQPQIGTDGQLENWVLQGAGWGHGVGMCQRSAQNLAADGWSATKILNYFYKDIDIRRVPD